MKNRRKSSGNFVLGAAFLGIQILVISGLAWAQLSPGDLSKPHTLLEGVKNCIQCHDFEQQISGEKCLKCHTPLAKRIQAGQGLHSRSEYKRCPDCHIEHQGPDYDLIYWKGGQDKFDHSQTGYRIDGKHLNLDCRKCHRAQNISGKDELLAKKINLDRTYLGLTRDCRNCHTDEHRGQFAAACDNCHSVTGWKPAGSFDHDKAQFKLTGKHVQVQCDKCHPSTIDHKTAVDSAYVKFADIPYARCLDCHKDVHLTKFGSSCETCHSTSGWKNVAQAQFDHSKTSYPLQGRHSAITCDKCHKPGQPLKIAGFQQCSDCHSDYHAGQFSADINGKACDKCHTVNGYSPSSFTIADHSKTGYPLAGSHLAVPCIGCHEKTATSEKVENVKFKYESTRCSSCHKDPHKGQVDKYARASSCEFCHQVESWKQVTFDHAKTKFALNGKHKSIECRACHLAKGQENWEFQFTGLKTECRDCHKDIHAGQFALAADKSVTECARCHLPSSWKAEKFDHNRDSAFKLDGAHIKVACQNCHRKTTMDNVTYTIFKPLNSSCNSCHGGAELQKIGSGE